MREIEKWFYNAIHNCLTNLNEYLTPIIINKETDDMIGYAKKESHSMWIV